MHSPSEAHMDAVICILRYLNMASGRGLVFSKNDHLNVEVTWRSKKQKVVARSSAVEFHGFNFCSWGCAAYRGTAAFGDDVVIVAAYRTAICKAKHGGFKDTSPDGSLAPALRLATIYIANQFYGGTSTFFMAVIKRTNLNPNEVGDIVVGTVMAPGSLRATEHRMAAFYAGFPDTVPITTVNRQCSSSLQAVADVAAAIKAGYYDIGIAAGLESMTVDKLGGFSKVNPKVSDGAGAVLLMKRSLAMQKGLPILGVFRSFAAVGVDPAVMGVLPAAALPIAVQSAGLGLDDIDLFEINEAFASRYVYCVKKLELDPEKVNVNGGTIALGHPLGATGSHCVATLLDETKRRGKDHRFGVISMCIACIRLGFGLAAAHA
ncbi:3-ketoacyl-CoA thiolase 2 [Pyrus ussuriensis x Pyrus communis]|uniref:3-ketoacyl-CoA thiolase 2 n=1 Tax=Pyrus ussuriensis x Pyrus communis TaxID=2448454 RepID=A0A5N5INJ2_9ROSA|nr:3-ketoacyl-CoA thiolase 2 [Pyrus ussuriensis x Pyrus communis]